MQKVKPERPQPATPNKVQDRDLFFTPRYATELIIPFIKTPYVWECAAGEGHISKILSEHGFSVVSTDLIENKSKNVSKYNFLDTMSNLVMSGLENKYTIVTNPPYSLKKEFTQKCIELDVPFALLIPSDYCSWLIDAVRFSGCEKLVPTRRIDCITPTGRSGKQSSSQFHSIWLTRGLNLGASEVYVELSLKDKERIY